MNAVLVRFRSELRRRWLALLLLGIVAGATAGASVAAAAGARRTETAYPRFLDRYESSDLILGGISTDDPSRLPGLRARLEGLPQVAEAATSRFVTDSVRVLPRGPELSFPEILVLGDETGRDGFTMNKMKVLDGRLFHRSNPREAVVDFNVALRFDWVVGQRVELLLPNPRDFARRVPVPVEVVGIVATPGAMPTVGSTTLAGLVVSPALLRERADLLPPNEEAPAVRLKGGVAQIPSYIEDARRIAPNLDFPANRHQHQAAAAKTLRFEWLALWLLSGLVALAFAVIIGQAMARQAFAEADDYPVLRSLGMSRASLFLVGVLRAAVVGGVAAAVATGVAVAASVLTPIGLSRLVEPDPGIRVDGPVLAIGAAATVLLTVLLGALPNWFAAGRAARSTTSPWSRPSRLARAISSAGAGPATVTGVRLAFESGRGPRATPVRTAIAGACAALAALVAAGTFTQSLERLGDDPSLYGFGWDVIAGNDDAPQVEELLRADPDVEAFTRGGAVNIDLEGKSLIPFVYDEEDPIRPTILEGEAPDAPGEIALGSALLRSLRKEVGDTVQVQMVDRETEEPLPPRRMRVIGRVVVPPFFFQQLEPGEGSAMTLDAALQLQGALQDGERVGRTLPSVIRYREGVDLHSKVERLRSQLPGLFVIHIRQPGADLRSLQTVAATPVVLTQILLVMAATAIVHTLVTSVRRRRRDLAILKTLGFTRDQVVAAVSWQASLLTLAAVIVGIPAGIALGRWAWRAFANTLGVVAVPVIPAVTTLALLLPAAVVLANVAAILPARIAARTQPAVVLRTE